jgi:hypothetical protein
MGMLMTDQETIFGESLCSDETNYLEPSPAGCLTWYLGFGNNQEERPIEGFNVWWQRVDQTEIR